MPRRPIKKKRVLFADPVYNSISVNMLVNRVMKSGKKSVAYKIVYNTLKEIGDTTQKNPVEVFENALEKIAILASSNQLFTLEENFTIFYTKYLSNDEYFN